MRFVFSLGRIRAHYVIQPEANILQSIPLSSAEKVSHVFFAQLESEYAYCVQQDKLLTSERPATHMNRLVVAATGLNLEKLQQVQIRLGLPENTFFSLSRYNGQLTTHAAQLHLTENSSIVNQQLETVAAELMVELAWLPNAPVLAQRGVLVMDMDSTMIGCECIDEIAILAGVGEEVSEVTEQAMQGKLDFAQSLRARVACLKGANERILAEVRDRLPIMPGLSVLLTELQKNGWITAVASGGFTYFADYLRDRFSLDAAVSNQMAIRDGVLIGEVDGDIIDAQAKADTIAKLATTHQIDQAQTIAMGDGANDLVMMAAAGLGIAFHAKPIVREQASAAIRHNGLDCLLHMLG